MQQLNWAIQDQWRPYFVEGQVAGYIEVRDGLTFATVHGAGHMVPQDKREQAYYLINNWIKQEKIWLFSWSQLLYRIRIINFINTSYLTK